MNQVLVERTGATVSRQPWLHQKDYINIDTLLKNVSNRKLQSEHACLSDKQ